MDDLSLFERIRRLVSLIPKGKVCTYGRIAKMAGIKDARKVGWALWGNQNPQIPCHRVVMADGSVAKDYSLGGGRVQKELLEKEGVIFVNSTQVDFPKCLWTGEN